MVHLPRVGPHVAAPDVAQADAGQPPGTRAVFKLDWTRTGQGGTPIHFRPVIGAGGAASSVSSFLDAVEAIELRDRGVTLCLYEFRSSGSVIGHGVRYMRAEDVTYSRADVARAVDAGELNAGATPCGPPS